MKESKPKKYQKPRHRPFRWQPLLLALGGLALMVAAFFALRQEPAATSPASSTDVTVSGAPSLQVDQDVVDLGDIKVDQPVQVSFNLSNVGDQPLEFSKAPYVEVVEGC